MLICPNCNNQVEDNAASCPYCGVQFLPVDDVQMSEAQATTVLTPEMQNMYNNYQSAPNMNAQPARNIAPQMNNPQAQNFSQNMAYPQQNSMPVAQLKTNRSFIKTLLLSLVTFGIYAIVTYGHITDDVNLVCSRYDGKKSMNYYLLIFIVTPLTLGIATIVWMHNICNRIGNELKRRGVDYSFSAKDFWLWNVLGCFILVGPFVFIHKFFTAVNKMNENFNLNG